MTSTLRSPPVDQEPDSSRLENAAVAWLVPLVPALAALLVTLWRLDRPALWRDEAATLSAARRPLGDLFQMLDHIDAVHGAYYVLMHGWTEVFGIGVVAVRLPSVMAAAVAAGGTAWLGRRLGGRRVGLFAGLLVAASPFLSHHAQEARQYSIAAALAVVSTCLFVRAVDRGTWLSFGFYAVSVTLLGWIHLFALFLLPVHALALWAVRREWRVLVKWGVATAAGLAAVVPLALRSMPQTGRQVEWIEKPDRWQIELLLDSMAGSRKLIIPVLVVGALGVFWRRFEGGSKVDLRIVAFAWAFVPIGLLLGISLVEPYYVLRYVVFCVPGVALLVAAGLGRVPLWGAGPAFAALVALTVPMHLDVREPDSRTDDNRTLASVLRDNQRPGDGLVFRHRGYRLVMAAYPDAYRGLRDVALGTPAIQANDLQAEEVAAATLPRRLLGIKRVWYVDSKAGGRQSVIEDSRAKAWLIQHSGLYAKTGTWPFKGGTLSLYVRR